MWDLELGPEQLNSYFVSAHAQVRRDVAHDPAQSPNSEDTMARDGQAVRDAADGCGQRHVAASLPDEPIAVAAPEQRSRIFARQIAGQSHTAMASSLRNVA